MKNKDNKVRYYVTGNVKCPRCNISIPANTWHTCHKVKIGRKNKILKEINGYIYKKDLNNKNALTVMPIVYTSVPKEMKNKFHEVKIIIKEIEKK